MSKENLNLSEAAAEILKANVASKKGMPPEKLDGKSSEIGNANLDQYDLGDIPSATPPGEKPPVDSAPMPVLDKQPASPESKETKNMPKQKGVNEGDEELSNEDIKALMAGENLSEEFQRKATAIFESAVKTKVSELAEELEAKYVEQFKEAYEEMQEDFSNKIDQYLDYVVENWMEENKLVAESGLKTEIIESFIGSLKDVFQEHYIDIPEEKLDVVEELASKVEALETQVNEEMAKNIDLKQKLMEQKKIEVLHSVCEGLTLSQSEKIKSIAESVEFVSEEDFIKQMDSIKESYSIVQNVKPASTESLNDPVQINEETKPATVDPKIAAYASKISKTLLK